MMEKKNDLLELLQKATGALIGILSLALILSLGAAYLFFFYKPSPKPVLTKQETATPVAKVEAVAPKAENGTIDEETGFIIDAGWELAKTNCTNCHAATLVTQNRATREGWEGMIRWMQRTQKLWDLGENEAAILDYLAKNYAPENKGRRPNLTDVEWYELEGTK
ncbi:MAG: cytochrome C [Imperialibacter sp.]|uniref:cytochrome C n=1 Tax=Imperialibacter sp. TaxID=2038411 RepID=UPI003A84743D